MAAPIKSRDCVGSNADFSTLILTTRDKRRLRNMEVETLASCLDYAARVSCRDMGIPTPVTPDVGHHNQENLGKDSGSSG